MNDPSGERFVPELMAGQLLEAEHLVRYSLAAQYVAGKHVLDAGCGVGWGTRILLDAGAESASGLDIDPGAVADARRRTPSGEFVQGDLAALPWDDGRFDVVVCFEALEHLGPQKQVLDELVRVLAPGGVLLVSSPNPLVYPEGNPFHVHELTPDELLEQLQQRVSYVSLWHQYSRVGSLLLPSAALVDGAVPMTARFVATPTSGGDPYSLCVASRHQLPTFAPTVALAPADQLVHLQEASEQLAAEQAALAVERDRLHREYALILDDHRLIAEERRQVLTERVSLLAALRAADEALQSERLARVQHVDQHQRSERERQRLRRDRERTSWLLLESEQRVAELLAAPLPALEPIDPTPTAARPDESIAADQQIAELYEVIDNLRREIHGLRTSTSWRATRPMRTVTGLFRRGTH